MKLPEGWVRATIADVSDTKLGKMLDAAKNRGSLIPYLRNVNVRWGTFDLADLQEMRVTQDEVNSLAVQDGDLFVCEGGEPGRCAVWRGGERALVFQKAIHRVRPLGRVNSEYLAHYIRYKAINGDLTQLFTGTTIKHLPQVALQRLSVPIPPAVEQRRIVGGIDRLLARSRRVREELERVAKLTGASIEVALLDRLEAALLAKAFRGELVPQDPNDEPASVLLERIRAERAAAPKARRGRRVKEAADA